MTNPLQYHKRISLTPFQNHQLYTWILENKDSVMSNSDMQVAGHASSVLGFIVSANHILRARAEFGWQKAILRPPKLPHIDEPIDSDEQLRVKINVLARCVEDIYCQLGIESPAHKRLHEVFVEMPPCK